MSAIADEMREAGLAVEKMLFPEPAGFSRLLKRREISRYVGRFSGGIVLQKSLVLLSRSGFLRIMKLICFPGPGLVHHLRLQKRCFQRLPAIFPADSSHIARP
jgi:hypothetical protein